MKKLGDLGEILGEEGFITFLNELPSKLDQFKLVDFEAISTEEALKRVRGELTLSFKLDLFQVLNLLFEGKIYFSLLLETPSPDLKLIGVEEV
jgi:hypothetical protein